MDGFKRKLNHSIQFRLSLWISIIIFLMALISVIISYFSALNEAEEIQDDSFKQIAQLIQKNQNTLLLNDGVNNVSKIIIQSINSKPIQGFKHLNLPNNLPDGFHTLTIDGFKYRILKVTLANQQVIAIAQKTILPDEAALSGAISTALPMLLLLPILIIVAYLLIRHAFVPMLKLSEDIQKRSAHDLTHLQQANMPIEVLPFISSINLLFDKVNKSVELQNRFIADAAHELRSPLTALSLQSERLANAEMSLTAAEHLSKLRQGISRAAKLVEQLLSFAKAQRLTNIKDTNLSVNQTILNVLEDLIPIAENKSLNISIKSNLDVTINMNEVDLICIIKNLIDNAIRYTPNGGEINLSLSKDSKYVVFEVEDSGHGIPESEKERVFDSFYRILGNNTQGSGLGLSIVKTIINRVEGRVQLLDSDSFLSGLKIKVFLPIKNI